MALLPKRGPVTSADLKAEVYESLLRTKEQQLLWALDRLKEADRILGMLCDAASLDEFRSAQVHAMAHLDRGKKPL